MFRVIRASFNQRRKTLQNGLGNDASLPVTKRAGKRSIRADGTGTDDSRRTFIVRGICPVK